MIDPLRETITFATPHNLRSGDSVVYRPADAAVTVAGLSAGSTYTVRVLDPNTIQLVAPSVVSTTVTVSAVGGGTATAIS